MFAPADPPALAFLVLSSMAADLSVPVLRGAERPLSPFLALQLTQELSDLQSQGFDVSLPTLTTAASSLSGFLDALTNLTSANPSSAQVGAGP